MSLCFAVEILRLPYLRAIVEQAVRTRQGAESHRLGIPCLSSSGIGKWHKQNNRVNPNHYFGRASRHEVGEINEKIATPNCSHICSMIVIQTATPVPICGPLRPVLASGLFSHNHLGPSHLSDRVQHPYLPTIKSLAKSDNYSEICQ